MNNDLWTHGLWYFEIGNYYAAREYWEAGLGECNAIAERVQFSNALVPVYYRLRGPEQASEFAEAAVELSEQDSVGPPLRMRCYANWAQMLCELDRAQDALRVARRALTYVSDDWPLESILVYRAYIYTLTHADLYRDILRLERHALRYVYLLGDARTRARHGASFLRMFGYAAQALREYARAAEYFMRAVSTHRRPETVMDECFGFLLSGEMERALALVDGVQDALWKFPEYNEKFQLAYCLCIVGAMAYASDRKALSERCIDKAELYFGQLSKWNQWISLRDWRMELDLSPLNNQANGLSATQVDWQRWNTFLDDINLLDGLEMMFPTVFRMSRIATDLAVRLADELLRDSPDVLRDLQVAGRMVYLGFTVMYADQADVLRAMQNEDSTFSSIVHATRLLQAYPHSGRYCDVLDHCLESRAGLAVRPTLTPLDGAAQCLSIALRYVENMALRNMSHQVALANVTDRSFRDFHPSVTEAFRELMTPRS